MEVSCTYILANSFFRHPLIYICSLIFHRAKYHGKKIIAGVDICQRLSGGALKMAAFDKLLVDYNLGEKGAVVLIQRCSSIPIL